MDNSFTGRNWKVALQAAVRTGPDVPIVIHVPSALAAVIATVLIFCATVIALWLSLMPQDEELEHIAFYTPVQALQLESTCRDVTNYGDKGVFVAYFESLGELFIKKVIHPDEMIDLIQKLMCDLYVDDGANWKYSYIYRFESASRSTAGSCFLPGESHTEYTMAAFGSIVDLKSYYLFAAELLAARYQNYRLSDPEGDHPDFAFGQVETRHENSVLQIIYEFMFSWPFDWSRPMLKFVFQQDCASLTTTSSYEIFVDCQGKSHSELPIPDECNGRLSGGVKMSTLSAEPWQRGNHTFIHLLMKDFHYLTELSGLKASSNCLPVPMEQMYNDYFPEAQKRRYMMLVEAYRKEPLFSFSCKTFRGPSFYERISFIYPWVSVAATIILTHLVRFVYKFFVLFKRTEARPSFTCSQDFEQLSAKMDAMTSEIEFLKEALRSSSQGRNLATGVAPEQVNGTSYGQRSMQRSHNDSVFVEGDIDYLVHEAVISENSAPVLNDFATKTKKARETPQQQREISSSGIRQNDTPSHPSPSGKFTPGIHKI